MVIYVKLVVDLDTLCEQNDEDTIEGKLRVELGWAERSGISPARVFPVESSGEIEELLIENNIETL